MTNKELLELAAKAAGYKLGTWNDHFQGYNDPAFDWECWNPLTDNGDAFRLAVKLYMDFTLSGQHASVVQADAFMKQEYCNGDPCAATRRAIVKVAAEIGKAQEK